MTSWTSLCSASTIATHGNMTTRFKLQICWAFTENTLHLCCKYKRKPILNNFIILVVLIIAFRGPCSKLCVLEIWQKL